MPSWDLWVRTALWVSMDWTSVVVVEVIMYGYMYQHSKRGIARRPREIPTYQQNIKIMFMLCVSLSFMCARMCPRWVYMRKRPTTCLYEIHDQGILSSRFLICVNDHPASNPRTPVLAKALSCICFLLHSQVSFLIGVATACCSKSTSESVDIKVVSEQSPFGLNVRRRPGIRERP